MNNLDFTEYDKIKKFYQSTLRALAKISSQPLMIKQKDLEYNMNWDLYKSMVVDVHKFPIAKEKINGDYVQIKTDIHLVRWNSNMSISISDNGIVPQIGEILVKVGFSTGAYIFGNNYNTDLFDRFFRELMTFNYTYSDVRNRSLYFKIENAHEIYEKYDEIFNRYLELNRVETKQNEITELQAKIKALQEN